MLPMLPTPGEQKVRFPLKYHQRDSESLRQLIDLTDTQSATAGQSLRHYNLVAGLAWIWSLEAIFPPECP